MNRTLSPPQATSDHPLLSSGGLPMSRAVIMPHTPLNPCGQASVNEHVSERHLRRSPSFYFKGMCKRQQTRHRTTSQLLESSFLCDITPPSTPPQHLHRWNPDTACSSSRSRACGAPSKGPGILLLARAPRTSLSTQMSPRTEGSARQQSRQEIPL